jgi:hypothetical protein
MSMAPGPESGPASLLPPLEQVACGWWHTAAVVLPRSVAAEHALPQLPSLATNSVGEYLDGGSGPQPPACLLRRSLRRSAPAHTQPPLTHPSLPLQAAPPPRWWWGARCTRGAGRSAGWSRGTCAAAGRASATTTRAAWGTGTWRVGCCPRLWRGSCRWGRRRGRGGGGGAVDKRRPWRAPSSEACCRGRTVLQGPVLFGLRGGLCAGSRSRALWGRAQLSRSGPLRLER